MIKIYFDMDGTLAKFYADKQCLTKMYDQNYFGSLEPYALVNTANALANDMQFSVSILSACVKSPYCKYEKKVWANKYTPNIRNLVLCDVGQNKASIVKQQADYSTDDLYILIDDYGKNIEQWEQAGKNFVGIKFINGINNKSGKEYKYKIRSGKQLVKLLCSFV